jgi:hypothetical protein
VAVHHIYVKPVGTRGKRLTALILQVSEISRKDRGSQSDHGLDEPKMKKGVPVETP